MSGYLFFAALVLSPVPVKTGIDFLASWHSQTAGRIGRAADGCQPLGFQLLLQEGNDLGQTFLIVNKMLPGIFQKLPQSGGLF